MKNQTLDDEVTTVHRTTFATTQLELVTGQGNLITCRITCLHGPKKDEVITIEHNISYGDLRINDMPMSDLQRRLLVEFLTQKD